MPLAIEGWIEVTTFSGLEQEEDYAWQSVINLGALIDVADDVSGRLFGLSKRCLSGEYDASPLAARRGLPSNPSAEVRRAVDRIAELESEHGPGEFGGYTYALWRELKTVSAELGDDSDWKVAFDLARRLEQDHRFNEDRIRIVVWYSW